MSAIAASAVDHHIDPSTSTGIPNKKLFMWAFLASDCMFFGTLISTHLIYRLHPPVDSPDPTKLFSIELTSFSTFILLMSSLLMALAVNAIQRGNLRTTRLTLLGTIIFGCVFLSCQVYEFNHFVHEGLTLSSSVFGSTFYVLTGTHGTHVAIGVLWLVLMYVRSFKPAGADSGAAQWLPGFCAHAATIILSIVCWIGLVTGVFFAHQGLHGDPETYGQAISGHAIWLAGAAITTIAAFIFARPRGEVDFNEHHAIDVESMGLYWHFVDIVWIVIFTAVYLIEFLPHH